MTKNRDHLWKSWRVGVGCAWGFYSLWEPGMFPDFPEAVSENERLLFITDGLVVISCI